MVEILFVIGLLGWLAAMLFEYLYTLPSFGTVVTALLVPPIVAAVEYYRKKEAWHLQGIGTARSATPPERFYWPWRRDKLFFGAMSQWAIALPLWVLAFWFPVAGEQAGEALVGVTTTGMAAWLTGAGLGRLLLHFHASQWFDRMTPWIAGFCRRTLYRLSDNPEFLGDPTFAPTRRRAREAEPLHLENSRGER